MYVAAHGDVSVYCDSHGMTIHENITGELTEYKGACRVVVTDVADKNEFYYLKYILLRKKIELVSTRFDDASLNSFVLYLNEKKNGSYLGKLPFGFQRIDGVVIEKPEEMKIAQRILKLRDSGFVLREIKNEIGGVLSISTIHNIIKNRERYENVRNSEV